MSVDQKKLAFDIANQYTGIENQIRIYASIINNKPVDFIEASIKEMDFDTFLQFRAEVKKLLGDKMENLEREEKAKYSDDFINF